MFKKIVSLLLILLLVTGCGKKNDLQTLKEEKLNGCNSHTIANLMDNYLMNANWREEDNHFSVLGTSYENDDIEMSFVFKNNKPEVVKVKINNEDATNDEYKKLMDDMCLVSKTMGNKLKEVDVKVNVLYNEEAYVVEGIPKTVKASIYGNIDDYNYKINLDLRDLKPANTKQKVYYTYDTDDKIIVRIEPKYANVLISDKVTNIFDVEGVIKAGSLSSDLEVINIKLDHSQVVIKASDEVLRKINKVKAIYDLAKVKDAGVYVLSLEELVAYDKVGRKIENIEIVPNQLSGEITVVNK